jgi:limonene-1,2-epoxide hydrolase
MVNPEEFVEQYVAQQGGRPMTVDRLVTGPSGLDAPGMMAAMADPRLGRLGIQLMADFMAPAGSLYYDAIFGGYHGQAAIRNWLVPAMAEIEFIDFVPTAESALLDDGAGGTSVDEWRMVMNLEGQQIPLSRGVSVRRFRDGWITWACDVYDTGPFRVPGPDGQAAELPPVPPLDWTPDGPGPTMQFDEATVAAMCAEFHPTDSVYHDPLFGEFHGREAIQAWLTDVMPKVGRVAFDPLGQTLDDGRVYVQEFLQHAVVSDTHRVPVVRGTSVRRRDDAGLIVYAADYFDTASMADPAIAEASVSAGATISGADVIRYRGA